MRNARQRFFLDGADSLPSRSPSDKAGGYGNAVQPAVSVDIFDHLVRTLPARKRLLRRRVFGDRMGGVIAGGRSALISMPIPCYNPSKEMRMGCARR